MKVTIPEVASTAVLEETRIEGPTIKAYCDAVITGSPAVLAIEIVVAEVTAVIL